MRIRLYVHLDDDRSLGAALATAHQLWEDQTGWHYRILDCATASLLPTKNEGWLKDGERECTADQFRSSMELQSVSVHPNGSFEFWFGDNDLFWGHAIVVYGGLAAGPTAAALEG